MAMNRVVNINVETAGRSDTDIAVDIKNQLQAAGVEVTSVEYTTDGNKRMIKVINESNDPNAHHDDTNAPDINLTINGQAPPADAHKIKLQVENQPGDTDETIKARIVDQLRAQGMEADVVVQNGKVVSITPIKH